MEKTELILPTGMKLTEREKALRMEGYWEILVNYRIEVVEEAFMWARSEMKFFPPPKELIDHIIQEENERNQAKRIEWREPTEDGRMKAKELFRALVAKLDAEDVARAEEREIEFENKRVRLQKQKKLMEVK